MALWTKGDIKALTCDAERAGVMLKAAMTKFLPALAH